MTQRSCEKCGGEIPAERVETIPETRLCVKCSEAMGGEFERYASFERTSKAESLKKNYGGVNLILVRKPLRKNDEE